MKSAAIPSNEKQRLGALLRYHILDTEADAAFDDLTALASNICNTPISLVSLVDADRQWFKSRHGLDASETDRSIAFCAHAILNEEVMVIGDTLKDDRFADNPLVVDRPNIRFYAGAPLITSDGFAIGTLCVINQQPQSLTETQISALQMLSRQVISQLELRLRNKQLQQIAKDQDQLYTLIAHDLRAPFTGILGLANRLADQAGTLKPEKISSSAKKILSASMSAYHLLDELLIWSQTHLAPADKAPEPTLVAPLATQSIEFIYDVSTLKQLSIENKIPQDCTVFANDIIIKTLLRNLLSNAVKYCPHNGSITIGLIPNSDCDSATIFVANTGDPLPPSTAKIMFEEQVTSRLGLQGERGSGIGLLLCNRFVKEQGGKIWADTEFTEGVKICFSLPTNNAFSLI